MSVPVLVAAPRRFSRPAWFPLLSSFLFLFALALPGISFAAAPQVRFDLPADSAEASLKRLSRQSGVAVLFPTDVVSGIRTNAVHGEMTARAAIDALLAGTALVAVEGKSTGSLSVQRKEPAGSGKNGPPRDGPAATDRSRESSKKKEPELPPNQEPMKRNIILSQLAAALALLTAPAEAQTASTATASSAPAGEKAIELSPFVVNAEEDTGYVATNTLGGSRLNTRLIDTAAAIDVLTVELLQDIGAFSLEEALEYATNTSNDLAVSEGSDNLQFEVSANRVNMRGIPATRTRNYLPISYSADTYNVERVEEQRGPNSILFGIGSPAGIVNVNTKRAIIGRSSHGASLTYNSAGGYRAALDLNQKAGGSLAFRLNLLHSDLDDEISHHAYRKTDGLHFATSAKLGERIRIRAEIETANDKSVQPNRRRITNSVTRWLLHPATPGYIIQNNAAPGVVLADAGIQSTGTAVKYTWIDNNNSAINFQNLHQTTGSTPGSFFEGGANFLELDHPDLWDMSVNPGGPGQLRKNTFSAWGGAMDIKITEMTFIELAFGHNELESDGVAFIDESLRASPNRYYVNGTTPNPYAGNMYFEGQWRQFYSSKEYDSYRATLSQELDLKKFGNYRIALMYEHDDEANFTIQRREGWRRADGRGGPNVSPMNAANKVWRRHYIEPGDLGNWKSYYASSPAIAMIPEVQFDTGQTYHSAWYNQNGGQVNDQSYKTALIGVQARYLKNRLVVGLGYREDTLDQRLYSNRVAGSTTVFLLDEFGDRTYTRERWTDATYKGKTKTAGSVFHINEHLRLMYNYSNNFGLPHPSKFSYPDNGSPDNTEGIGHDYGVGFSFFDNKLSGRLTRFTTDATNAADFAFNLTNTTNTLLNALVLRGALTQPQADAMEISGTGGTFDQHVEGYEFSLTYNPTRNWRFRGSYSYTDGYRANSYPEMVEYLTDPSGRLGGFGGLSFFENPAFANYLLSDSGANAAKTVAEFIDEFKNQLSAAQRLDGVALSKNVPHKANFFTRYSFSEGRLKGLFVGGGVKYQSAVDLGVFRQANGDPVRMSGDSRWTADALLGYSFRKIFGLKRVSVQLNITNVFNDDDPIIIRRFDTPPFAVRAVTYERPRQWRLTTNFGF